MTPLLELDQLRVELQAGPGLRPVVLDVSLSVQPAEIVGLVGESGSGKSMTARAVMRLLPRGARLGGRITFDGRDIIAMSRTELQHFRANDVAMIFQEPRAYMNPIRRIGDFLVEALVTARGVSRADAEIKVTRTLLETGIRDPARRLRQYPHELSGGLLQRVMIAAALAIDPRLIIADEPTTALDVTTQAEVMALLHDLREQHGLALLFITHNLDLAAAVCDRTAVMYAGRIAEVRPSSVLHTDPRHPYTAALGASRPSIDSATRLVAIPGRPASAYEIPIGCPFAPRCQYAIERCTNETPELLELATGVVACHRSEELRGRLLEPERSAAHA